jgi:ATP-dependent DNA ligase
MHPASCGFGMKRHSRGTDIGDVLFRDAWGMGLEGIASKRLDRSYSSGRCRHWIKVKNRAHPAYSRVRDLHQSLRLHRCA